MNILKKKRLFETEGVVERGFVCGGGGLLLGLRRDLDRGEELLADDRTTSCLTSCLNGRIYKAP